MTNYEKIKAMSVEEMARVFSETTDCGDCQFINECTVKFPNENAYEECKKYVQKWLESEVEEDG